MRCKPPIQRSFVRDFDPVVCARLYTRRDLPLGCVDPPPAVNAPIFLRNDPYTRGFAFRYCCDVIRRATIAGNKNELYEVHISTKMGDVGFGSMVMRVGTQVISNGIGWNSRLNFAGRVVPLATDKHIGAFFRVDSAALRSVRERYPGYTNLLINQYMNSLELRAQRALFMFRAQKQGIHQRHLEEIHWVHAIGEVPEGYTLVYVALQRRQPRAITPCALLHSICFLRGWIRNIN